MKICRFSFENQTRWGVIRNDLIYPFENFSFDFNFSDFIKSSKYVKRNGVTIMPPVIPSKIVCVGRNYAEHAAELGNAIPKEPLLFLKAPSSLVTDRDAIVIPKQSSQVEHEGELAIVLKRNCKNLTENDNPFDYIFGYTCLNDVTARDLQRNDVQFTRAKSFDTFCPIGASIETELDVLDICIKTKVNGVIKQDGRTSQMVFSVPFLIRYISNQMTLLAGDVVATGTPSGVSKLENGDLCEVEIEGIGTLQNPVI
jgi:2-keto-4-pentenoate hydratase/2-oxohepta-3-ene-1,7-dioic acid hydratase in catechol pathway